MIIGQAINYACAEFGSVEEVIAPRLTGLQEKPRRAVIAVAGPVVEGAVRMTNLGWNISERGLVKSIGFWRVRLVNNFSVFAFAAAHLGAADLGRLGHDLPPPGAGTIAVVKPGTGSGAAALARAIVAIPRRST